MIYLKVLLGSVYMLICLVAIIIILMQESKSEGLSNVITGDNSESFFSKNKGKGLKKEQFLSKLTVELSVAFAIVAIILSVLMQMD